MVRRRNKPPVKNVDISNNRADDMSEISDFEFTKHDKEPLSKIFEESHHKTRQPDKDHISTNPVDKPNTRKRGRGADHEPEGDFSARQPSKDLCINH